MRLRLVAPLMLLLAAGCGERQAVAAAEAPIWNCDPGVVGAPAGFCERVAELGRFESAGPGPVVDGRPTVTVFYNPAWGTGIRIQSVALLAPDAGYKVLWDHASLELSSLMPATYPDEAIVYTWRYSPDGDRITVTGTRTVGTILNIRDGRAEGEQTVLPAEAWCYEARSGTFVACA